MIVLAESLNTLSEVNGLAATALGTGRDESVSRGRRWNAAAMIFGGKVIEKRLKTQKKKAV